MKVHLNVMSISQEFSRETGNVYRKRGFITGIGSSGCGDQEAPQLPSTSWRLRKDDGVISAKFESLRLSVAGFKYQSLKAREPGAVMSKDNGLLVRARRERILPSPESSFCVGPRRIGWCL